VTAERRHEIATRPTNGWLLARSARVAAKQAAREPEAKPAAVRVPTPAPQAVPGVPAVDLTAFKTPAGYLTEVGAREILRRRTLGEANTTAQIAADLGVSRTTVNAVASGRSWTHLQAA
jgi:hypothetical protein